MLLTSRILLLFIITSSFFACADSSTNLKDQKNAQNTAKNTEKTEQNNKPLVDDELVISIPKEDGSFEMHLKNKDGTSASKTLNHNNPPQEISKSLVNEGLQYLLKNSALLKKFYPALPWIIAKYLAGNSDNIGELMAQDNFKGKIAGFMVLASTFNAGGEIAQAVTYQQEKQNSLDASSIADIKAAAIMLAPVVYFSQGAVMHGQTGFKQANKVLWLASVANSVGAGIVKKYNRALQNRNSTDNQPYLAPLYAARDIGLGLVAYGQFFDLTPQSPYIGSMAGSLTITNVYLLRAACEQYFNIDMSSVKSNLLTSAVFATSGLGILKIFNPTAHSSFWGIATDNMLEASGVSLGFALKNYYQNLFASYGMSQAGINVASIFSNLLAAKYITSANKNREEGAILRATNNLANAFTIISAFDFYELLKSSIASTYEHFSSNTKDAKQEL